VATHKSARKRARQSIRRTARNRHVRSRVKGAVKRARLAIGSNDVEEARTALRTAESVLRRAASKGVVPRKRASRQISRLARHAHQLETAP
jgi:small subunit ribosomal protein S20